MAIESLVLLLNGTTTIGTTGERSCWLQTKPLDCGNDKVEKFWEGVVFELEADTENTLANIEVYFGTQDRLKDDPTFYGPFSIATADSAVWFPTPAAGGPPSSRYGVVKMVDNQITGIWALTAFEILGEMDGGRM